MCGNWWRPWCATFLAMLLPLEAADRAVKLTNARLNEEQAAVLAACEQRYNAECERMRGLPAPRRGPDILPYRGWMDRLLRHEQYQSALSLAVRRRQMVLSKNLHTPAYLLGRADYRDACRGHARACIEVEQYELAGMLIALGTDDAMLGLEAGRPVALFVPHHIAAAGEIMLVAAEKTDSEQYRQAALALFRRAVALNPEQPRAWRRIRELEGRP